MCRKPQPVWRNECSSQAKFRGLRFPVLVLIALLLNSVCCLFLDIPRALVREGLRKTSHLGLGTSFSYSKHFVSLHWLLPSARRKLLLCAAEVYKYKHQGLEWNLTAESFHRITIPSSTLGTRTSPAMGYQIACVNPFFLEHQSPSKD